MPSPDKKRHTCCPVTIALDTFGDRWSLLVIRDLMCKGRATYGEFLESGEGIATNVLANRLKDLESANIIQKSRDPENRRRYLYRLTEKGCDLIPIILEMIGWSAKHDPQTVMEKKTLKRIKNDRDGLIAEIRARIKAS
ncbi:MAG: helix-turn-helix transcriptional regulator [Rhodospirillaceae bacterium]|jgi:DNA-binding HxlR family transcriptional regulator|nr:helix-turn-helix transcriptional regulator [Rhodospirillaceae bacterium]MBT5752406.1 helix-turn-helix transcriptional regulator [Rhodospirillaceae bacterium]